MKPSFEEAMRESSDVQRLLAGFGKKMPCICPECERRTIDSHSQQKEGALRQISRNGRVFCVGNRLMDYSKRLYNDVRDADPDVCEVGIGQASTFRAFCSQHDSELFSSIEQGRRLEYGNPEQIVALYRRAFSYMFYCEVKETYIWGLKAKEHNRQFTEGLFLASRPKFFCTLERYLPRMWDANVYEHLGWEWRIIESDVRVSCTTFFPAFPVVEMTEFYARHIDRKTLKMTCPYPFVTFSLIPEGKVTHAVMIWDKLSMPMVNGLRKQMRTGDPRQLARSINDFVFVRNSDFCVAPELWESLPENVRQQVRYSMRTLPTQDLSKVVIPPIIRFDRVRN